MQILKILDDDQLRFTQNLLAEINFKDGKESAKGLAKQVKNNKRCIFGSFYSIKV